MNATLISANLFESAGDFNLPVVIHVGFQTARYRMLDDARPLRCPTGWTAAR